MIQILYIAEKGDNVATALSDMVAGTEVWAVDCDGTRHKRIILTTPVPKFFKVAMEEIRSGQAVKKWGHQIGTVPTFGREDIEPKPSIVVRPGTVVHLTNFMIAPRIVAKWPEGDPLAHAISVLHSLFGRSRGAYSIGKLKYDTGEFRGIDTSDIAWRDGVHERLFAEAGGGPVGYVVEPMKAGSEIHIGALHSALDYQDPSLEMQAKQIADVYCRLMNMFDCRAENVSDVNGRSA